MSRRAPLLDRRQSKTQAALRSAFFDLIRAHGYENISIADIVARADVGRSTFYEHYRNKHDVLRASMAMFFAALADAAVASSTTDQLGAVTAHLWENRKLANAVFTGAPRLVLLRQHADLLEDRLTRLARESSARPIVPLSLAALHVAEAQITLLHGWLTGRTKCGADAMAEALHASAHASVSALLRLN